MNDNLMNKKSLNPESDSEGFVLAKKNYIVLAIGFALIILGFILLSGGKSADPAVFNKEIFSFVRISLAPIVIVLGFVVEIFAIMWKAEK